jgi:hypothetical protein
MRLIDWRKSPEAIFADNATRPPAKSVVFAGCADAGRLRRFGGNFSQIN